MTPKPTPPKAKAAKAAAKAAPAKKVPAKKAPLIKAKPAPIKATPPATAAARRPAVPEPPPADFARMLNVTQFAAHIGANVNTIWGYVNRQQGGFPDPDYTEPSGRRWYYPETAEHWAANRSGRGRRYDLETGQTRAGGPPWRGPRAKPASDKPAAAKVTVKKKGA